MTAKRCPICDAAAVAPFTPFCCQRCADVDLGRWLKGTYRVPTNEQPETAPPVISGGNTESDT